MPVPDTERVHRDLLCPRPSHTAPIRYCSSRQQGKGHQRSVHVYSTLLQPCSLKMERPRLQFPAERWAAKDLRILGLSVSCRETGTECLESTASSQQRCQDSLGWGGGTDREIPQAPPTHTLCHQCSPLVPGELKAITPPTCPCFTQNPQAEIALIGYSR